MELISREEAIKTIVAVIEQIERTEEIQVVDRPCGWESIEAYVREIIGELPTIESRPKGKWRTSRVHGGIVKCDFCGFDWGSNEGRKFNFCPKCGADMRGEE